MKKRRKEFPWNYLWWMLLPRMVEASSSQKESLLLENLRKKKITQKILIELPPKKVEENGVKVRSRVVCGMLFACATQR